MSADEDEANFLAITGCADPAMGRQWLEMAAGDLHAAVALYMDQGGLATAAGPGGAGGGGGASLGKRGGGGGMYGADLDEDGVRKADETKRQRLIDHQPHRQNHLATAGFVSSNGGGAMAGMAGLAGAAAGGGGGSSLNPFRDFGAETRGAFGRGGSPYAAPDAGIGALFAPPMKLLFKGPFIEARAAAKQGKRWLLVNIQSDAEFASHLLNRDVFKDELVASLIADGFVFWQAQFTVPEARCFLDRYHQNATVLPLLAILDPRTQRLLWSHTGKLEAEEMAAKLTEICSTFSLDDDAAMPLPPPPQPPRPVQAYDRSEDEQLALALAASMQEEEQRRKTGNVKGEVVDVEDSSDEAEGDDSEVEVVGMSSPGKKGKKQIYSVDDDEEDAGQGGNIKHATTTATASPSSSGGGSSSSSSNQPEAAAAAPSYLGAPLEQEPAAGSPDCTRIQVRLPDGKRLQRVFPLAAPVASLYRFAHEAYVSAQGGGAAKGFDLTTMFPAASLKGAMERGESLGQAKLANSAVSLIWTG